MFAFGDREWPGVAKFIEESGEMGQVLGRLVMMRGAEKHWSGADLRSDFIDELADVKATIRFIEMKTLTEPEVDRLNDRCDAKLLQFLTWHREQAVPEETEDEDPLGDGSDYGITPIPSRVRVGVPANSTGHRDCRQCRHFGHDMEDAFCGHDRAMALSCFGKSFAAMHELGLCTGSAGELFEAA